MLYVHTALYPEAKALITRYDLKKEAQRTRFQLFGNEDMRLIVSGTGAMKAAIATTYLIARTPVNEDDLIFNIGICGARNRQHPVGTAVLANQLLDHDTQQAFYPDVLARHNVAEGSVETFSHAVRQEHLPLVLGDCVDMEATGFFQAASTFFSPHQIGVLKVISDFLQFDHLTASTVTDLTDRALPAFESVTETMKQINVRGNLSLDAQEQELMQKISRKLRLSVTMEHELHRLVKQYKIARQGERSALAFLQEYVHVEVKSKQEGKNIYARLRQRLIHA